MDPLSDEWTTFLTMPEKLITPSKSALVNVIQAEQLDSDREDVVKDIDHDGANLTTLQIKENEDGTLFEMDLGPVENRALSDIVTDPTKKTFPSNDDEILKESSGYTPTTPTECNLKTDEDQTDAQNCQPISKHVLRYFSIQIIIILYFISFVIE